GAAEWCHWCHVMDETTYLDPSVGALIASRFVAVRVDIDERPDFAERYAEDGWPPTILLAPDGTELGKLRGYPPPERPLQGLQQVTRGTTASHGERSESAAEPPAPVDALGWIAARVARDLDGYYDDDEGGWGARQKMPIGTNLSFELRRAERGNQAAKERAR